MTIISAALLNQIRTSLRRRIIRDALNVTTPWRVSTGRGRYRTPVGHYRPYYLKRRHYSRKYRGAPMPYSIFFRGGYAVHGTNHIRALGRRASHGCIRLHPVHAARLYSLVRRHGKKNTRIIIGY